MSPHKHLIFVEYTRQKQYNFVEYTRQGDYQ